MAEKISRSSVWGIGGRMSTRYTDDSQFDHGAPFFTARSKNFQGFLKPFIEQNIVQEWMHESCARRITTSRQKPVPLPVL